MTRSDSSGPRAPGNACSTWRGWPAAFLFIAASLTGCGYVGDPLPPSLGIPVRIADLAVVQRGDVVIAEFTAPAKTLDEVPIRKLDEVDLRIGPDAPDWEARSQRVQTEALEEGRFRGRFSAQEWTNRDVIVRARASGRTGRFSEWSEAVRRRVVAPLETPRDVRAEAVPQGVRVSWNSPGGTAFRVFRRAGKEQEPSQIGTSERNEFIDATTTYGEAYEYSAQAFVEAGDANAESDRSQTASVKPVDRFAPAVPSAVAATAGAGAIQVTWNPNTEPDLKGYYVYRSSGGEFSRIGDLLVVPNFSDSAVQPGQTYRYAASAVDQNGNESDRSPSVEATAQ